MSIHDKIAQDIDDLFYAYECAGKCKFSYDTVDKVIEQVKITALRRFKNEWLQRYNSVRYHAKEA